MVMSAPVLLGIIAVVFGLVPILFRSNAVYVLLALCGGEILAKLASQDVTQIVNSIIQTNLPTYSIVQIVLLVLPPLLVLIWYRKSVRADIILQIIPAVSAALLCFMFVVAKLPYDTQSTLQNSDIYAFVKPYFGLAIAVGMASSLVWFWTKKPHHEKHDKKKHGH